VADVVRVWCLRHGESENVLAGAAGALPLAPLTPTGYRQALAAARLLDGNLITRTYPSTAIRTQQTAACLAGSAVTVLPELDEAGVGSSEGATDAATRRRTAEVLRAWVVDRDLDQRVADGENGHEVVERITRAFELIAVAHPGETVAVVGHVASLTAGLSVLCGLGRQVWGLPLPHAVPFLVAGDGSTWHCDTWPGLLSSSA
jgi:alpha-ribazole phosphatase/probable phosphoglycerate mutase